VAVSDLAPILRPGVEVLHLRRRGMPLDADVVATVLDRLPPFDAKLRVDPKSATGPSDVVARLVDPLPASPVRDALAQDMVTLLAAYAELRGGVAAQGGMQVGLWLGERVMCPKLHTDNVGLRLLCTYLGPATEWVPDAYVDRRHLCCADHGPDEANRLIAPDPTKIVRAAAFDVVVLKGDAYPGNRGRGAVHRTPPDVAAHGKRLVFKVDDLPAVTGH
jgi:hypothetical protein